MADFVHDAEIDAGAGQALRCPVSGEIVEEAVGGGVGGLAAVADDAADGGEHDEEIQGLRLREEGVVEVPGTVEFGLHDRVPVGEGGVLEENVLFVFASASERLLWSTFKARAQTDLVHVGTVNDSSNRWHALLAFTDHQVYLGHIGYVALADFDLHIIIRQLLHHFNGIILSFPTP